MSVATLRGDPALPDEHAADYDRPTLSDRLPRPWLFPVTVFAAVWLLTVVTWFASDALYHQHRSWTLHFLFKDAYFYMSIAHDGYPHTMPPAWDHSSSTGRLAFFPLLPMLIRGVAYLTGGHDTPAALIVMVLAGAASMLGVWLLAARIRDRWTADRAVLLFGFFPGAMTFGMVYAEPLGAALAAFTLLAVVERRWILAGVLAAFATAEREQMIVLAPVLAVAALQHLVRPGPGGRRWRALLAPALAPLGMLAFFAIVGRRYHMFTFWFYNERVNWGNTPGISDHTIALALWQDPAAHRFHVIVAMLSVMFAVAVIGTVLLLTARLPLPVTLYAVLIIAIVLLTHLSTKPRYEWVAFPLFIAAAAKLPRWLYWPLLVLSAAGLVFLTGWWPSHMDGPAP